MSVVGGQTGCSHSEVELGAVRDRSVLASESRVESSLGVRLASPALARVVLLMSFVELTTVSLSLRDLQGRMQSATGVSARGQSPVA